MSLWRTGRKIGRTIYFNDACVGMMDSAADAKFLVDAANNNEELKLLRVLERSARVADHPGDYIEALENLNSFRAQRKA